mmetsp:Transcript_111443/g.322193  ORF Transcript_111443/g.322193 Transcript_111443/m.322193 type:complete len:229 (-) Transcript_111443:4962-5648(-)
MHAALDPGPRRKDGLLDGDQLVDLCVAEDAPPREGLLLREPRRVDELHGHVVVGHDHGELQLAVGRHLVGLGDQATLPSLLFSTLPRALRWFVVAAALGVEHSQLDAQPEPRHALQQLQHLFVCLGAGQPKLLQVSLQSLAALDQLRQALDAHAFQDLQCLVAEVWHTGQRRPPWVSRLVQALQQHDQVQGAPELRLFSGYVDHGLDERNRSAQDGGQVRLVVVDRQG